MAESSSRRRSRGLGVRTSGERQRPCTDRERVLSCLRQEMGLTTEEVIRLLTGKENDEEEVPFDPESEIGDPSRLTDRKEWKPCQFNDLGKPRWLGYRGPSAAAPEIPLVLLHESFETFCARARSASCMGLSNADYDLATYIWDRFSRGFDREKVDMTGPLKALFTTYLDLGIILTYDEIKTDGMIMFGDSKGRAVGPLAVFEDKMDASDGYFQVLENLRKAFRSNLEDGLPRRLSHSIAVIRSCPYIQFVAVVMNWESSEMNDVSGRVMAEPLTDQINCFGPKETGLDTVCKALRAFKDFCMAYSPEPYIDVSLPYKLRGWSDVKRLSKSRLVFSGKNETGLRKVAKFTANYSYEAHAAWAVAGVACQVDEVQELTSGWKFVVMELVDAKGWTSGTQVAKQYKENKAGLEKLQHAMKVAISRGHNTGYVHGDARVDNLFVRELEEGFEVKFIDFDWAGSVGEAVYRERLNPKLTWHADAQYGSSIQPEHDLVFADNLVH